MGMRSSPEELKFCRCSGGPDGTLRISIILCPTFHCCKLRESYYFARNFEKKTNNMDVLCGICIIYTYNVTFDCLALILPTHMILLNDLSLHSDKLVASDKIRRAETYFPHFSKPGQWPSSVTASPPPTPSCHYII